MPVDKAHKHIHQAASHSVSHVYVEYSHDTKFVTKNKAVVEAVLLDDIAAKQAEEEHLAEDARQAELAREAIAAAKAAEDARVAEELEREEELRAEEAKAIIANARKSMRWPPVGECLVDICSIHTRRLYRQCQEAVLFLLLHFS